MVDKKSIESDTNSVQTTVIGTFEGECADSNITNLNGLDITRPVWEAVFASEEYKQGIENGWYIGFLGHPEDPNCMNFEHACIVMTEGHIDNDGKIYGKFNLIDTPVGRIVKSFQDAGVQFGISVRGAGDIVDNSVDPETFVFRGFDLVSFPAYPESIPTFTEIAASSDIESRKKYKAISAAIKRNVDDLNSCQTIDVLQPYFAEQSEEYQILEDRKSELQEDGSIDNEQLDGVLDLYLEELEENKKLKAELSSAENSIVQIESAYKRKIKSLDRITSSQIQDLSDGIDRVTATYRKKVRERDRKVANLQSKINMTSQSNLKYKQKIDAANRDISTKNSIISSLRTELDETVNKMSVANSKSSNLGAKIEGLQADIAAAHELVKEYQDAYASLYANALGVNLDNVIVSATTTVNELQELIRGSHLSSSPDTVVNPTPIDVTPEDDDGLITL